MRSAVRQSPILVLFVFALLAAPPAARAAPARIRVVLADHLSLSAILQTGLPNLARLRDEGALALVSPGSPRPPDPVADLYATLSAGDVVNIRNPHLALLQRILAGHPGRVTIVRFGDAAGPGRLAVLDMTVGAEIRAQRPGDMFLLCGVVPPRQAGGGWDRLTPAIVLGDGPPGATLTSDTTHTPGLIALRDVAPSILSWAGIAAPQSMTGAPARPVRVPGRDARLARMDTLTRLNQHILLPLAWFLGLFGGLALLGTVWALAGRRVAWSAGLRYLLRLVLAFPLAVLLAPVADPQSAAAYAAIIFALDLVIAFIPSAAGVLAITAGVVTLDGLTGAHLVAQTALSGYWLPGIRFYGIGNEYMGVLLGAALAAPFLLTAPRATREKAPQPPIMGEPDLRLRTDRRRAGWLAALALWFGLVTIALSFPSFGAKAGGAVTATVCFAPAWFAVALGWRIGWVSFAVSALAGFALVFLLAFLAQVLGLAPTHIQDATGALLAGRVGYIWHVALRKAKMAVQIFLHPGVVLTLVGLALCFWVWRRSRLPVETSAYLAARPDLARALRAGLWGVLACVLFNDAGTVAAFFLFGTLAIALAHEMVGALSAKQADRTYAHTGAGCR